MAQRLVRKLCPDCKRKVVLEGRNKKLIDEVLKSISDKTYLEGLDVSHVWENVGCEKCNFTGYKGRVGIYEAIVIDENIERIVKDNPSEREIKKVSISQNILDIRQDGVVKILEGITTLEELERVVDVEKE